jgi:predicted AAA+ superfamily ATPase
LENALLRHNPHWKAPYGGLQDRAVLSGIIDRLHLRQIHVLKGIRRSGKTTIFKLLINHLGQRVDPRGILYVNLDDPFFTELCGDSKHLYRLLELSEKITGVKVTHLFLDEVQNVSAWEKFVKALYDSQSIAKIFITGSNSSLLDGEYAKLLSGRYIQDTITPLSFAEVLKMRGITNRLLLLENKPQILQLVDEMMEYGSFYEVLLEPDHKRELILSYYDTIVFKDCMASNHLRDAKSFKEIAHFIISNSGSLYSYNSIAKATLTNDNTVKEYIRILEDSYLGQEIRQYAHSLKEQIKTRKKFYLCDNGFLAQTAFRFSRNFGKTFENLVFTEFAKRGFEVYFHNKEFECDFLFRKEGELLAVQVCYDLTPQNSTRELQGLWKLKLDVDRRLLITYNQGEVPVAAEKEGIEVVAFWDYFSGF